MFGRGILSHPAGGGQVRRLVPFDQDRRRIHLAEPRSREGEGQVGSAPTADPELIEPRPPTTVGGAAGAGSVSVTVWLAVPELAAKLEFPGYVAVSVRTPALVRVIWQLPEPSPSKGPVQKSPPSLTVTIPLGVPDGELTVKVAVIGCADRADSSGLVVRVVVVLAGGGVTVCSSVSELLLKLELPA